MSSKKLVNADKVKPMPSKASTIPKVNDKTLECYREYVEQGYGHKTAMALAVQETGGKK